MPSAFRPDMQSDVAIVSLGLRGSVDGGSITLFRDKSKAIVRAIERYVEVSSSAQCSPAEIHGILTINARIISTDL